MSFALRVVAIALLAALLALLFEWHMPGPGTTVLLAILAIAFSLLEDSSR